MKPIACCFKNTYVRTVLVKKIPSSSPVHGGRLLSIN